MGTNSDAVEPVSVCYERYFVMSLSEDTQFEVVEAFNFTSRYLDDMLSVANSLLDSMVDRIYIAELQLNRAGISGTCTGPSILNLHFLLIFDGFVAAEIFDKRNNSGFGVLCIPFKTILKCLIQKRVSVTLNSIQLGYNVDVMRQSACLEVNTVMDNTFAVLLN